MGIWDFSRSAFGICAAAAMLAGCGGSQPPIGAPGAMPQSRVVTTQADRTESWMLPEAKSDDLLYVGGNSGDVTVYSYPKGRLVETLNNPYFFLPAGECVDKAGDVFITDVGADKIFAYRHAAKRPFETLQGTVGESNGCAIDPTTGDLAVTSLGGNVAIYPHARGTPQTYVDPNVASYFWCGYDPSGNLFFDGQAPSGAFAFADLSSQKKFTDITLPLKMYFPGGVQWDGKYVAVGDQGHDSQPTGIIFQFKVTGSRAILKGTTTLERSWYVHQFWIQGDQIIGGSHNTHGPVHYWDYPAGGRPTKRITKGVGGPVGMTVSLAPGAKSHSIHNTKERSR